MKKQWFRRKGRRTTRTRFAFVLAAVSVALIGVVGVAGQTELGSSAGLEVLYKIVPGGKFILELNNSGNVTAEGSFILSDESAELAGVWSDNEKAEQGARFTLSSEEEQPPIPSPQLQPETSEPPQPAALPPREVIHGAVQRMNNAQGFRGITLLKIDDSRSLGAFDGTQELREQFTYSAPDRLRVEFSTTGLSAPGPLMGCSHGEIIVAEESRYQRCLDERAMQEWTVEWVESGAFSSTLEFQVWSRLLWCDDYTTLENQFSGDSEVLAYGCSISAQTWESFAPRDPSRAILTSDAPSIDFMSVWVRPSDGYISRLALVAADSEASGASVTLDYFFSDFGPTNVQPPGSIQEQPDPPNSILSLIPDAPPEPEPQAPLIKRSGSDDVQFAVINGRRFTLEFARDEYSVAKGLSGRVSIPMDYGMLFLLPYEGRWAFWMKDVAIPLDILFIDESFRIVDMMTMSPQQGVPDDQLTIYRPLEPASYALEINAGLAKLHAFQVGDLVLFE